VTADLLFMAYSYCWLLCMSQGVVATFGTKVPVGLLDNMLTIGIPQMGCSDAVHFLTVYGIFAVFKHYQNQFGWLRDFKLEGSKGLLGSYCCGFGRSHRSASEGTTGQRDFTKKRSLCI